MYKATKQALSSWNQNTNQRQKLQHAYISAALVLVVAAGIFSLVNQPLGQQILSVAIAAAVMFLANSVAWALLQSFVLLRLPAQPDTKATSKK